MSAMLIETTLREGEQRYGVYFRPEDKRRLAEGLARLGVEELELGCVGCEDLAGLVRHMRGRPGQPAMDRATAGRPALSAWCRLRGDDLEAAASLGLDRVNVGLPVSDAHLASRLGLDRAALLGRLRDCLGLARRLGLGYVSVGLEDASRADPEFVCAVIRAAELGGARRVRLSDTVGLFSPPEIMALVRRVRAGAAVEVAVHCHDDLGMGTANAVSALCAGADYADASLLGLGERAGLAATEEVAAWLALRRGRPYRLEGLRSLCALAGRLSGAAVPGHKAVAGAGLFACESGLHAHGLDRDPGLYEPFSPAVVGGSEADRCVAVGKKSGRAAVALAAERLGLGGPDAPALTEAVRRRSRSLNRPLTDQELLELARDPLEDAPCQ